MKQIWLDFIENDLKKKKEKDLFRTLSIIEETDGNIISIKDKKLINFASNNYLGLMNDKRIINSGIEFSEKYGAGSGASRLVSGNFDFIAGLENDFAEWNGTESCLIFNSGYNANIGVITSFCDDKTVVFCDKLNHASIYDGIFQSGAKLERYNHKDTLHLLKLLEKYKDTKKKVIITDSVFSMEGDIAPLRDIVCVSKDFDCLLIVDEAHSAGIFSEDGAGLVKELNLTNKIDVVIGTLGKSFGVFGAYVAGDKITTDFLINNARSFIYTTGLPPFIIGALKKSLEIIKSEKRGKEVLERARKIICILKNEGINTGESDTQIIPVITGTAAKALELSLFLRDNGIFAPAIRPPTVPPNASRVRLSLNYLHNENDIEKLIELLINFKTNE